MPDYIRWDDPKVETVTEGEQKKIYEVSAQFKKFQMRNFDEHHHCLRGTHPKTQGCVVGKFKIHDNLPAHLAQGMFAQPGEHDVIMRYSSLTPKLVPDNVAAPRGLGMKIFGVKGEKLWGEDKETQDWTFNNYPILELRDPQTTYEIADALERNWENIPGFFDELGKRKDADVAMQQTKIPRQHMVAMPQYSQSAYRFGDYVAKLAVFPLGEEQKKLEKTYIQDSDPMNTLSQELQNFHKAHTVTYSFCAQLLQNLDEQPVEDTGVLWDETKYPFEQVATLTFAPQNSWIPGFRVWWDDRITVNSWHGLKTHQPLGSTNRMRRVVYAESRKMRLWQNGIEEYVEPKTVQEVPLKEIPQPA